MADRPIIFSAPMVRALLDGRKTQTRRVLNPPYGTMEWLGGANWRPICTKFFPGDRLWVREAFSYDRLDVDRDGILPPWYWADGNPADGDWTRPKPSIHMPRWASRLTLHVTEVRVQRLQEIDAHDAIHEGMAPGTVLPCGGMDRDPVEDFCDLWNSLHGEGAWDANPWVCAISFTVERANIDATTPTGAGRAGE